MILMASWHWSNVIYCHFHQGYCSVSLGLWFLLEVRPLPEFQLQSTPGPSHQSRHRTKSRRWMKPEHSMPGSPLFHRVFCISEWLFSHSELIALSFLPNLSSCSLKDRYNACGITPGFSFLPGITNERGVGRGPQLPLQTSDKYRSTLNFCLYKSSAAEYCYCLLHCKRCKNCNSAWYFVGVQWNAWLIHKWMDEGIDGEERFLSQKWKDAVVASLLGASMLHGSLEQHAEDWGSRTHNLNLKTQHLLFFLSTGLPLFQGT